MALFPFSRSPHKLGTVPVFCQYATRKGNYSEGRKRIFHSPVGLKTPSFCSRASGEEQPGVKGRVSVRPAPRERGDEQLTRH